MKIISNMMKIIIGYGDSPDMADLLQYQSLAKSILKAELKRRGVSYKALADKLSEIGVHDNERNIANKVSRGTFSAAFFLQCLSVIGCKNLTLED